MTSDWRFFAADLMSGVVREEIPLQQVTVTDRLKAPSTLQASIPFRHPKATRANLSTEVSMLIATRDDVVQFAGPLLDIQLSENAELLSLQCEDMWSFVRTETVQSRQGMSYATGGVGTEVRFTGVDQFRIVDDLIDHLKAVSGGFFDNLMVAYDALSGVTRDRTYERDDKVGERIEELANVQNGFDWALEVGGTVDNLTHTLRLHYPMRGRNTGYVLSWDGGTTMLGMSVHESSRQRAQRVVALGAGEGAKQTRFVAQDPNLIGVLPPRTMVETFPDVSEQATIEGHARRLLGLNKRASVVPSFTLNPDVEPRWGTYITGDTVRVVVNDGWVQIDGVYRVIARSITVDEDGQETSKVELAELGRFA